MLPDVPVESVRVSAYTIPTEMPESDGTLSWDSTTIVVVEASAGGKTGLGYTYAHTSTATLIQEKLAEVVQGRDATSIPEIWLAITGEVRNLGRAGVASAAISAVDSALWDLKGQLLDVPLVRLLGSVRGGVAIYGSGGFTW